MVKGEELSSSWPWLVDMDGVHIPISFVNYSGLASVAKGHPSQEEGQGK